MLHLFFNHFNIFMYPFVIYTIVTRSCWMHFFSISYYLCYFDPYFAEELLSIKKIIGCWVWHCGSKLNSSMSIISTSATFLMLHFYDIMQILYCRLYLLLEPRMLINQVWILPIKYLNHYRLPSWLLQSHPRMFKLLLF